jgi:hypothetical protein
MVITAKRPNPNTPTKKKNLYSRLTVTNNYDNGKPQPPGLKKVVVNEIDTDSYKNIASIEEQNGFKK